MKQASYISNHSEEKRILRLVIAIGIVGFGIIALYTKDYGALVMGLFSVVLIWYAHFIIKKYFPDGDKYILVLSGFLTQFGLIIQYRIDTGIAIKQIGWFTIGMAIFLFIVILFPDLEVVKNLRYVYLVFAVGLLLFTQVFANEFRGSRNWVNLGFASFQPSEFSKIFIILYLASALKKYKKGKDLIEPAIVILACLGLLVLQKDLGSAIIFFSISITIVYIATSKFKYVIAAFLFLGAGGTGSYFLFNHVRDRVAIWLDPWSTANDTGYQIVQSLFAIASGGFIGTGLYLGHPKYIPLVYNDSIFAIICEEFGILGGIAIIITYLLLVYRGFRAAIYANNTFSRLLAVGISTMIGSQVFVIIGGNIKLIPLTGITLPLISYGGSSLIINCIALGILQKISEFDAP